MEAERGEPAPREGSEQGWSPWQSEPEPGAAEGLPGGHAQHRCGGDKAVWPHDTDGETEARRGRC